MGVRVPPFAPGRTKLGSDHHFAANLRGLATVRKWWSDPNLVREKSNKENSMQQAVQNTSSPLERNITVSIPVDRIEAEIATRLKKLARTVKMQGFRPGHVPLKMVERHYGFQVRQEVVTDEV